MLCDNTTVGGWFGEFVGVLSVSVAMQHQDMWLCDTLGTTRLFISVLAAAAGRVSVCQDICLGLLFCKFPVIHGYNQSSTQEEGEEKKNKRGPYVHVMAAVEQSSILAAQHGNTTLQLNLEAATNHCTPPLSSSATTH